MLETNTLCSTLHVSRSWVNTYLRSLGKKLPSRDPYRPNVIWYDPTEVLSWFQQHASFSRQTETIDLLDYGVDKEEYLKLRSALEEPGTVAVQEERGERYENYLKSVLPADIYNRSHLSFRRRGEVEWVPVCLFLKSLDSLKTIRDIMAQNGYRNEEMAYRDVFLGSMIRVSVAGRTWFLEEKKPEMELPVVIRARA